MRKPDCYAADQTRRGLRDSFHGRTSSFKSELLSNRLPASTGSAISSSPCMRSLDPTGHFKLDGEGHECSVARKDSVPITLLQV